jgi:hypothetical protein
MTGSQEKATRKAKSTKGTNVKSLEFFKPTLATTLAIVLGWLLSVRPAQAGYTVTLQQIGPNVVATGSGAIDLTGLTLAFENAPTETNIEPVNGGIFTGASAFSDLYQGNISGPTNFGSGNAVFTNSGSGDMVAIYKIQDAVVVPRGYVSGTALSDTATWAGETFATIGIIPGIYIWTWGTGVNQNFTLQIEPVTHITNISTRASIQTGQSVTIAGFIITGRASESVVL